MYKTLDFDTYKEYREWLENVQGSTVIEIVSVVEFKYSLIVTFKEV